jgi:hypothetical protein
MKAKDLTGQDFGRWHVIGPSPKKNNGCSRWMCQCKCGHKRSVRGHNLRSGLTVRCAKCAAQKRTSKPLSKNQHPMWKGCGDLPGSYWCHVLMNAKMRNLYVDFTIDKAWVLFQSQDGKCAYTKQSLAFKSCGIEGTASLDRIDSSKGYVDGNLQWVHKSIQPMKMGLSHDEFIRLCQLVAFNHGASK